MFYVPAISPRGWHAQALTDAAALRAAGATAAAREAVTLARKLRLALI